MTSNLFQVLLKNILLKHCYTNNSESSKLNKNESDYTTSLIIMCSYSHVFLRLWFAWIIPFSGD
jgi:hypothetical protein